MSADNKNVFAKTGVAVLKAWVKNYRLHQFFTNKIKAEIKKTTNIGNKGTTNHKLCWALTMSIRFSEPTHKRTLMIIIPIETSYDTICAADRIAPRKGYLEFDAQPPIIIP